MSAHLPYDPAAFRVERAGSVSGRLGAFVLGASALGAASSAWLTVPAATFSYSSSYSPDENGTLILDSETASIALAFWDTAGSVLVAGERVRATYNGKLLFVGRVDSTSVAYSTDAGSLRYGAYRRIDFTATLVGQYAAAMERTVSWESLPKEYAIQRIRRWVTVDNW